VISFFGEPVKQSINSVFNDLNVGVEALDLFKKYRRRHFDSIKSTLGNIKILGMAQPIRLLSIYTPANVSTTIHSRLYERDWYSAKSGEIIGSSEGVRKIQSEIISADEYIESRERVVILGGPGSGKTTFLRFLSLAYSDKEIFKNTNLKTSKFPIFVSVLAFSKRKDTRKTLFDYIVRELEAKTDKNATYFLRRILDRGLGIILLDGLDEVSLGDRNDVIGEIKGICNTFPNSKIVVSCRTADYIVTFENFHEVELTKLTNEAVKKVIKAWFGSSP
jgi:predicted NACHT family NTPase